MMIPDKLYLFNADVKSAALLSAKANVLLSIVEDFYVQDVKNLSISLQPYRNSLTDMVRTAPNKLDFKFIGQDLRLECEALSNKKVAVLTTYNIVPDRNDYPHTKMIKLNECLVTIDEQGNIVNVATGNIIRGTNFHEGYIELLYDWYSQREIAA